MDYDGEMSVVEKMYWKSIDLMHFLLTEINEAEFVIKQQQTENESLKSSLKAVCQDRDVAKEKLSKLELKYGLLQKSMQGQDEDKPSPAMVVAEEMAKEEQRREALEKAYDSQKVEGS